METGWVYQVLIPEVGVETGFTRCTFLRLGWRPGLSGVDS